MVNINDNPKLYRRNIRRLFEQAGYRLDGLTDGTQTWRYEFDEVQFFDRPSAGEGTT